MKWNGTCLQKRCCTQAEHFSHQFLVQILLSLGIALHPGESGQAKHRHSKTFTSPLPSPEAKNNLFSLGSESYIYFLAQHIKAKCALLLTNRALEVVKQKLKQLKQIK